MGQVLKKLILQTRPFRYWFDRVTFKLFANKNPLVGLKDKYKNLPMFVIGNGPSLNHTPLDKIKDYPSIGMNKIDLIFTRVNWRPNLIVSINNLVTKQHAPSFARSKIPVFVSWKGRWYIKHKYSKHINYFLSLTTNDFSANISKGLGSGGSVTYTALQFAYYMGANPVILLGVDHNYSFNGNPLEIEKLAKDDQNHFDANYFKGMYWGLPDLAMNEMDYKITKNFFEKNGKEIYDATIDGKLRVFTRISFEDAVALAKKK